MHIERKSCDKMAPIFPRFIGWGVGSALFLCVGAYTETASAWTLHVTAPEVETIPNGNCSLYEAVWSFWQDVYFAAPPIDACQWVNDEDSNSEVFIRLQSRIYVLQSSLQVTGFTLVGTGVNTTHLVTDGDGTSSGIYLGDGGVLDNTSGNNVQDDYRGRLRGLIQVQDGLNGNLLGTDSNPPGIIRLSNCAAQTTRACDIISSASGVSSTLALNGGLTPSLALTSTSPALNKSTNSAWDTGTSGSPLTYFTDQRGGAANGRRDHGAYER